MRGAVQESPLWVISEHRIRSPLPPKADIAERDWNVRFVPKAEILRRSKIVPFVDHLVGPPGSGTLARLCRAAPGSGDAGLSGRLDAGVYWHPMGEREFTLD